jgi:hypothetical protein
MLKPVKNDAIFKKQPKLTEVPKPIDGTNSEDGGGNEN